MSMATAGAILFVAGAVSTLTTVGLWLINGTALPTLAYLAAMLMPVGLLLLGIDFVRRARRNMK
jgi:hypothetical protein